MTKIKTLFSKREIRGILGCYSIGDYISHTYLKGGMVETTVLLTTTKGKYILRYYNQRSQEQVAFEMRERAIDCDEDGRDFLAKVLRNYAEQLSPLPLTAAKQERGEG